MIILATAFSVTGFSQSANKGNIGGKSRVKIGLNFYSFDNPIKSGELDILDVINYVASIDMECVDITGYYFPTYPQIPEDEEGRIALGVMKANKSEMGAPTNP